MEYLYLPLIALSVATTTDYKWYIYTQKQKNTLMQCKGEIQGNLEIFCKLLKIIFSFAKKTVSMSNSVFLTFQLDAHKQRQYHCCTRSEKCVKDTILYKNDWKINLSVNAT